jgi:hypothetical protein
MSFFNSGIVTSTLSPFFTLVMKDSEIAATILRSDVFTTRAAG